jgi:HEPN domain-containing protein
MPRPRYHRALAFYRAAFQRFEDAEILLERDRLTGAFYLSGYGVECILKALILSSIDNPKRRSEVDRSFKGRSGHDIAELLRLVLKESGRTIPGSISRSLATIMTWTTDLRYEASLKSRKEAVAFRDAVAEVIRWADGCINDGSSKAK